jgi:hypothetical protein
MGRSVYADQHTYEVMREFAHQKRKKITNVLKDLVVSLEQQLQADYGIVVAEGADGPVVTKIPKKGRAQK